MRSLGISLLSLALTSVVIANAYYQKKQFYPSVVYITKSNPSMAVIYVQAFIGVWIAGKIMRKIFFGQLRTTEFEHLMERSWYAITETCLAFTVFRDDFNPKFVALFTLLLFLKSFHWLAEDRVDYMERSPIISWIFHIRVLSLLLLLLSLDMYFVGQAYQSTVTKGASVQLVFGFEYAVLLTVVVNIGIKYALHSVDLNSEAPWDNKAVFLLYTELVMGLIKVVLYVAFVAIMVRIYTLPLFAFRPMYYTIRNFKKAFSDVILSRRAIHNMNTLYPDATAEELEAADNVCIICREEMMTASKKLPCNHIFHTSCLRSWFQRQQTCPTCRLNILQNPTATDRQPPPPRPPAQPPAGGAGAPNPFAVPHAVFGQRQGGAEAGAPAERVGAAAFMPPPFPFPPAPFMAPPPQPPRDLGALSPDELRRMEQAEREGVEARIQCLRNIQMLLDAAVLMMQQYSTAAALSAQAAPLQNATAAAAANQAPPPGPSAANGPPGSGATCNGAANGSTPNAQGEEPTSTTTNGKGTTDITTKTIPAASTSSPNDATPTTADEELRRRRLQKFETPPAQQEQ